MTTVKEMDKITADKMLFCHNYGEKNALNRSLRWKVISVLITTIAELCFAVVVAIMLKPTFRDLRTRLVPQLITI